MARNSRSTHEICCICHQPIIHFTAMKRGRLGMAHEPIGTLKQDLYGTPKGETCVQYENIVSNLQTAIQEGFKPEFCRSHYIKH